MDGEHGIGREFSGAGYSAGLRDFARIGAMMLAGGKANGRQIIPADWIRENTRIRSQDQGPLGYGMQWWTIGEDGAYSAIGLAGQYIFVDPNTRTVAVELSYFFPPENSYAFNETVEFLQAVSAWQPD
jgi:CubicO group peptidase (beta-lactamase class C family)